METLQTSSGSIAKSEAEGSVPKGTGPLFLCVALERSVPIFLGHLADKCHRALNGFVQILARRERFCQTHIRPVLFGQLPQPSICKQSEDNHSNLWLAGDWH